MPSDSRRGRASAMPEKVLPGQDTLLASWNALAQLSRGAGVRHDSSAVAAVFPAWVPLNNAILLAGTPVRAVEQLHSVYAAAGVGTWALWLPSRATDFDVPDRVSQVGTLKRDTTTLVMRASLSPGLRSHEAAVRTSIATATRAAGEEPVPVADLAEPETVPGLSGWVLVRHGLAVSGAWSYLHHNDCGIYTVGTLPEWRRKGLARSLIEHVLAEAQRGGARTASLQSTRMGRALYESLGFDAVGRYEEWISQ